MIEDEGWEWICALALHLGRPSPTRMIGEEMDMLDVMLWSEYAQRHPFGEQRQDLRAAVQTAALVNVHLPRGRKAKVEDFLLRDARPQPRQQSWQEQLAIVQAMAEALAP